MKTLPDRLTSLRDAIANTPRCSPGRFLSGAAASVSLEHLPCSTCLGGRRTELRGRSVLFLTSDQLATALALIELDGTAARVVICPPDVAPEHLHSVAVKGGVDAIVSDRDIDEYRGLGVPLQVTCSLSVIPDSGGKAAQRPTEWILLTSGTTGAPKMIVHDLNSLAGHICGGENHALNVVWGTFYDIRRYGGLQIFLRAVVGGGSFILAGPAETLENYLLRLGECSATHISGTPSHWRRVLMSCRARAIAPRYIRLSGEISDQAILIALRSFYSPAGLAHAYASTEAGLGFEVADGLEGFPARLVGNLGETEVRIENGSLRIRSARTALRQLGEKNEVLADPDGFVDTGDVVERRGERYFFLGRRNGVINIGGLKVFPEEVEAVINRHPAVRMSRVRARRNPLLGSLVAADVVLREAVEPHASSRHIATCTDEILQVCRENLPAHKIPVTIRCVPALEVTSAGKLARQHA